MPDNRHTYEAADVVAHYERLADLQLPERTFLDRHGDALRNLDMLDVGVGGGRTTVHFAPLVRSYAAADFSTAMIESCRRRFDGRPYRFEVADARSLSPFGDASFDFILFSFNGLDYIDHDGRNAALSEIRRVSRPGALFLFSSHNMRYLPAMMRPHFSVNPRALVWSVMSAWRSRRRNPPLAQLSALPWALIHDPALDFRLTTYYIRPSMQLEQLREHGFEFIEAYPLTHEVAITDAASLETIKDPWIYYLAKAT